MDKALRVFRHNWYQEIIDASDVKSNDVQDLLCKCVECGSFVNWVSANKEDAQKPRPAHFRHNKEVSKQFAVQCEKKVQRYSKEKIERINRSLAESRSRFIRQEFWKIMRFYFEEHLDFQISHILDTIDPRIKEYGIEMSDWFRAEKNEDFVDSMSAIVDAIFDGEPLFFQHPFTRHTLAPSLQIQKHFIEILSGSLNEKLHLLICYDVLKFIKTEKKSLEICNRLFMLALHCIVDCLKDGSKIGLIGRDGKDLWLVVGDEIGVDISFFKNPINKQIVYRYAVSHVLMWIGLTPYNKTLENYANRAVASI